MTSLMSRSAGLTSTAASAAPKEFATASPSWTVVPAMSKTTNSITGFSQTFSNNAFRQAEGQRHAVAPGPGDHVHAGPRIGGDVGLRRMLEVKTVPALQDAQFGNADKRM